MATKPNQQRVEEEDYASLEIDDFVSKMLIERTGDYIQSRKAGAPLSTGLVDTDDSNDAVSERPNFLGNLDDGLANVIRFSSPRLRAERPTSFIVAIQEWEGYVDEVFDEYFTSVMYDVTGNKERPDEVMDIPLSLVDPVDAKAVIEGSIFRLVIGRERRKRGPLQNTTLLYFRKGLPKNLKPQEPFSELIGDWK